MQQQLFPSSADNTFDLGDGAYLRYIPQWLGETEEGDLFLKLRRELKWEQPTINVYGRAVVIPRLQSWYGEKALVYSGQTFAPHSWHPALLELSCRIAAIDCSAYNSVLANLYRDGKDSVSWHADDEPELGELPTIASLSLGVARRFQLKRKANTPESSIDAERITLELASGDLLIMSGACQKKWLHSLPKTRKSVGERINLTFRYMYS